MTRDWHHCAEQDRHANHDMNFKVVLRLRWFGWVIFRKDGSDDEIRIIFCPFCGERLKR